MRTVAMKFVKPSSDNLDLEDLMRQLLISKGFTRVGRTSDELEAAIQLCCELAPHIAVLNFSAQWN
jgi:hypothetical protein